MRPKARSSSYCIMATRLGVVAQRPLRRMTACAMVASFADVVEPGEDAIVLATGRVGGAGAEEAVDERAICVVDDCEGQTGGRRVRRRKVGRGRGCRSAGCLGWRWQLLTSSPRLPEFLRSTPAVGTAVQRAAALSTMAVTC